MHIFRQWHGFRNLAQGVVIATDDESTDVGISETAKLIRKKQPCIKVEQIAIEHVSHYQDKIHLSLQSEINNVDKRTARCLAHVINWCPLVAFQAPQRTVKMKVGTMYKTHNSLLSDCTNPQLLKPTGIFLLSLQQHVKGIAHWLARPPEHPHRYLQHIRLRSIQGHGIRQ